MNGLRAEISADRIRYYDLNGQKKFVRTYEQLDLIGSNVDSSEAAVIVAPNGLILGYTSDDQVLIEGLDYNYHVRMESGTSYYQGTVSTNTAFDSDTRRLNLTDISTEGTFADDSPVDIILTYNGAYNYMRMSIDGINWRAFPIPDVTLAQVTELIATAVSGISGGITQTDLDAAIANFQTQAQITDAINTAVSSFMTETAIRTAIEAAVTNAVTQLDMNNAINTAIANFLTETEIDTKIADAVSGFRTFGQVYRQIETAILSLDVNTRGKLIATSSTLPTAQNGNMLETLTWTLGGGTPTGFANHIDSDYYILVLPQLKPYEETTGLEVAAYVDGVEVDNAFMPWGPGATSRESGVADSAEASLSFGTAAKVDINYYQLLTKESVFLNVAGHNGQTLPANSTLKVFLAGTYITC